MHAVKGNLANTVCKRKHQHIASVPVLGGPCILFSNFDSFLRGQGVGVMDFSSLPPAQSHPDPKSRGGSLRDRPVCFVAHHTRLSYVPDNGALQQENEYIHLKLYSDTQHMNRTAILQEIRHFSASDCILYLSSDVHALSMGGAFLSSCVDNVPEPLHKTLLLKDLMFATHVNIWQSITFLSNNILLLRPWNESANKWAFYVYLHRGVLKGVKWRSHFLRQHFSRGRKKATKRMRGKERTILLPIAVTVSYLQNMTLLSLCLSQPRQKHERLHKHCFMQWLDESSDSNYSLPLTPTKLYCTDSSFDTELQ